MQVKTSMQFKAANEILDMVRDLSDDIEASVGDDSHAWLEVARRALEIANEATARARYMMKCRVKNCGVHAWIVEGLCDRHLEQARHLGATIPDQPR